MPIHRRSFMAMFLGFAGAPSLSRAQDEQILQPCIEHFEAAGWKVITHLPQGDELPDPPDGGSHYAVVPGQGKITLERESSVQMSPGQRAPKLEITGVEVEGRPERRVTMSTGNSATPWWKEGWKVEVRIAGKTVDRIGKNLAPDESLYGRFDPDVPFDAGTAEIVLTSPDGATVETYPVPLSGFAEAWQAGKEDLERRLAKNPEICTSDCTMTHAAVHLLGRSDTCFELQQMRALRAAFPQDAAIVAAYRAQSRRLLAFPGTRFRDAMTLAFYVAGVWPAALATRLGALHLAKHWYLFTFSLLCRAFATRTHTAAGPAR